MKKLIRILVIISYSTIASEVIAQKVELHLLNHKLLELNDGIYTNIEMLKNNSPIPSTRIETDMDGNDLDFYSNITSVEEIVFFDENGVRRILNTDSIWGYSFNGDPYINVGGAFHKIDMFGRYSHFFASKTTYRPYSCLEGHRDIWYNSPVLVTLRQQDYLVDIVNNKVWEFDLEGLIRLLKTDPQLWDEFSTLKKRERHNSMYVFLKRYNEKHPFDIPY